MKPMDHPRAWRRWIPLLSGCGEIEPILKGYSDDAKYLVSDSEGKPRYVLRAYGIEQAGTKAREYGILEEMKELDVLCSRPVQAGSLPDQGLGYMLVTYIEGEEASEALPRLPVGKQESIGLHAGRELRKIHRAGVPADVEPWQDRILARYRKYMQEYEACGIKLDRGDELLKFLQEHIGLTEGRPSVFQHHDYHVGNLIVHDGALAGIIDFNRYGWGDSVQEFAKAGFFSAETSVPFTAGQIRGYHDGEPDDGFWQLYAFYIGLVCLSSVPWIVRVRPAETADMLKRIGKVIDDHEGFSRCKPLWYPG
ncbi:phosphotransferase family protein [Paenibacillus humicus]|uniref:phosphotransferase family protein n=1 Tax=Paenibacillus humicus TaxID=412861 RepID=UPI001FE9841C|nr:phosphotransferase [Paenibacillus humicus]